MKKENVLKTPVSCPECGREFPNVYSLAGHKQHCRAKNATTGSPNVDHLKGHRGWAKDKTLNDFDEIFCGNSRFSTGYVKKVIQRESIITYECSSCGISDWRDAPIVLEIDHINGNSRDHRLENLRYLCPNCHSQTPTWRGRNKNSGNKKVSDERLVELLKHNNNRQALIKAGLAAKGGNYNRCNKLRKQHGL